jgi:hypothetical protein
MTAIALEPAAASLVIACAAGHGRPELAPLATPTLGIGEKNYSASNREPFSAGKSGGRFFASEWPATPQQWISLSDLWGRFFLPFRATLTPAFRSRSAAQATLGDATVC